MTCRAGLRGLLRGAPPGLYRGTKAPWRRALLRNMHMHMYMYMCGCDEHEHMMRPGLFLQREGPGSEPGNSLVCPDGVACCVRCLRGEPVSSELIA